MCYDEGSAEHESHDSTDSQQLARNNWYQCNFGISVTDVADEPTILYPKSFSQAELEIQYCPGKLNIPKIDALGQKDIYPYFRLNAIHS